MTGSTFTGAKHMTDIEFACPECGEHLIMDDSGAGRPVRCPHCKAPIHIEQEDDAESVAVPEKRHHPYAHRLTPDAQKLLQNAGDHQEAQRIWRKRKLWGHGVTGILTFLILGVLFGLPESLHPKGLLLILVVSCAIGLPSGLLTSLLGGGVPIGIAVTSSLMILVYVGMFFLYSDPLSVANLLGSIGSGFLIGALTGAIIGKHVELSQ